MYYVYIGRRISDKIAALRSEIKKLYGESIVVNALDDVACKRTIYSFFIYFFKFKFNNISFFPFSNNCSTFIRIYKLKVAFLFSCVIFSGLLNLRGLDIDYNPVFFAYAIVSMDAVHLYVLNKSRITPEIYKHFEEESVQVFVEEYDLITNGIMKVVSIF